MVEVESWRDGLNRRYDIVLKEGTVEDLDEANAIILEATDKINKILQRRKLL